jgi:hypothetical protein
MKTPYNLDNTEVKTFLTDHYPDVYDKDSFQHSVPSNLEDILYGATRQGNWNIKTSSYKVFMMLAQLSSISVITVGNLINNKQTALYGKPYSLRALQGWCAVLSCASGGIKHAIRPL